MRLTFAIILVLCLKCVLVARTKAASTDEENNISRGLDTKSVLSSIASNLMSRGYGTTAAGGSQVVSLNLTNLLVLVLLKALIFAAGSLGAHHLKGGGGYGGHSYGGYGRSMDEDGKLVTDEEILMYLSYLTGAPGDYGCLQNIACMQPQQAKKYVTAGDVLWKASKMFAVNPDENYQYVLQEVDQAANIGIAGGDCSRYVCSNSNRNR